MNPGRGENSVRNIKVQRLGRKVARVRSWELGMGRGSGEGSEEGRNDVGDERETKPSSMGGKGKNKKEQAEVLWLSMIYFHHVIIIIIVDIRVDIRHFSNNEQQIFIYTLSFNFVAADRCTHMHSLLCSCCSCHRPRFPI